MIELLGVGVPRAGGGWLLHRFGDAVRLRRWDDAAKVPAAAPPPLIEYAPLVERYFGPQRWPAQPGLDRGT